MKMDKLNERVCRSALKIEKRAGTEKIEEDVILEGTPIVFEQATDLGLWTEIIDKGALKDTDLKDVRFLVNHDTNELPLARSRNNTANSTMQLSVGDDGMHIRVRLDTESNPRAAELASAVKRGDIDGMSFMFSVDGDEWTDLDTDHPTRRITKIGTVYEVSAVTFPAYPQTSISARSLESGRASLDEAKKALESARKVAALRDDIKRRAQALAGKGEK